ncbi:MAG: ATP-binding protein [Candidatus Omnitrophica bacterium]|nr:ATP-binding protein [Candidatus Omnitrophota bacterium]MBU4488504.1 ATP-binding protein [Candidatus Omnitrophota bacterium]MCG2704584.1 ATP-binding protein [Candidatus Omnitrophota bacterium]
MIISIASGKGGTGKTTIAVNLALSFKNVQLLDCDVEGPNAHIFIKPEIKRREPAYIPVPEVDETKCSYCGMCRKVCAYNAIAVFPPSDDNKKGSVLIFPHLCHGCGACSLLCPAMAIKEVNKGIGIIEIGGKDDLQFIHGRLNIGEAMSPPIIRQVKNYINPTRTVIIDAPPGTSCPVITAVKGSDFCILVTEPTPFGLNDLILAVEVVKKLKIPFGIVINCADIGDDNVDKYCQDNKIPILLRIPFDREIALLYSKGIPIVHAKKEYKEKFQNMFNSVSKLLTPRAL